MMKSLVSKLVDAYDAMLTEKGIEENIQGHYKKWLRFYLDFRFEYHFPHLSKQSFLEFHAKLQSKNK